MESNYRDDPTGHNKKAALIYIVSEGIETHVIKLNEG